VEQPKPVEQPKVVEQPKPVAKPVEQPKVVEQTKLNDQPKKVESPVFPKPILKKVEFSMQNLDSNIPPPKADPLDVGIPKKKEGERPKLEKKKSIKKLLKFMNHEIAQSLDTDFKKFLDDLKVLVNHIQLLTETLDSEQKKRN